MTHPVLLKSRVRIVSLVFGCWCFITSICNAQEIRIKLYSAYVFDDRFDSYYDNSRYYKGKINGGFQWGVGSEYMLRPEYGVELLYMRQDTHAPTEYVGNGLSLRDTDFELGINYIMAGGTRHMIAPNKKVEGFAGIMGGMIIASLKNPDNGRDSGTIKFSWGVRGGGILWPVEKVGIKVQAQLLSAVQAMGGGFYFGSGGSGGGLTSYSTIYQFSLGGGLVFKIKS